MKPFVRLREGELSEAERALLDSASDDAPSFGAREKTLAALGLAAGASLAAPGVAHAAQGAGGVGASASASASAVKVGSVTSLMVLKWLGTGALVGTVAATGIVTLTTPGPLLRPPAAAAREASPREARSVTPARRSPRAGLAALPASEQSAPALRPVDEVPSVAAPARATPARGAVPGDQPDPGAVAPPLPSPAAAATGNVMEEVASLDRARAALAAHDASGALARLAAHEAAFPRGALLPEAILLRVRALRELGRQAEATAVAERFLASHPDSAQAARLRALVGSVH